MKFRRQKEQVKGVYFCICLIFFLLFLLDGQNTKEVPFTVNNLEHVINGVVIFSASFWSSSTIK